MSFVVSEFSKAPKHYIISQKIETEKGVSWKEVASVKLRNTAFYYKDLMEELNKA